jgi:signal transduction histidine kinase/ligand-binding sensor domain-containing protein
MRITVLLLGALVWLGSRSAGAVDLHDVLTGYTIRSWSLNDDRPFGRIHALAQDAAGYLWIGGGGGLLRFDGVGFVSASDLLPTPISPGVRSVLVARDGSMWVGFVERSEVVRILNGKVTTYTLADGLPSVSTTTLLEDHEGAVWAGTDRGLFRFDGTGWQPWNDRSRLPDASVQSGFVDSRGDVWLAAGRALFRLKRGAHEFDSTTSTSSDVRSITEDAFGRIWVTDPVRGLRPVGQASPRLRSMEQGLGGAMLRDRQGALWVTTHGQGLWRVQVPESPGPLVIEKATAFTGLPIDGGSAVFEDRQGNVWSGISNGLTRLTPQKATSLTTVGVADEIVTTADNDIWLATRAGLLQFSQRNQWGSPVTHLRGMMIRSVASGRDGGLWIATNDGLFYRAAASAAPHLVSTSVRSVSSMSPDAQGGVWVIDDERGMVNCAGARCAPRSLPASLRGERLVSSLADRSERVWLVASNGAIVTAAADGVLRVVSAGGGADGQASGAIYEGADGTIWLGRPSGLMWFRDGRFGQVDTRHGFPDREIRAIVDDADGNVWAGTDAGVLRLAASELFDAAERGRPITYSRYDRADGVFPFGPDLHYNNSIRAADGRLWFVAARGVIIIHPGELRDSIALPPARVGRIIADGRRLPAGHGSLPSGTLNLEIDFGVPNLSDPQRTKFRYQLEGFDRAWVEAGGRRQAFYTNLAPGEYRFRVVAANAGEAWPESAAVWDLTIEPRFYQTGWFFVASAAVLVGLVVGVWRSRLHKTRRQFALLLGERIRITREIHDTLLQALVGVALQCDLVANDVGLAQADVRERFIRMRNQLEEQIREARRSILHLRSARGERGGDLIAACRKAAEEISGEGGITVQFNVAGSPCPVSATVEEHLFRIGNEALRNAARHAGATRIQMDLRYEATSVTLQVEDDGHGFDSTLLLGGAAGHYGLASMKERAQLAGGYLTVGTGREQGTKVEAVVPFVRQAEQVFT